MSVAQWYFIINPIAGNGRGMKYWQTIQKLLEQANITFDFGISTYPQHSTYLASYAILKGYHHIAAVGGDGTINEVINGIFTQQKVPTTSITLAVIPIGTGNDWAKTHQIPTQLKKAVQLLIKQAKTIEHDIGKVIYHDIKTLKKEQRFFINVAGLAYDAFVTKASETRPKYGSSRFYYLYLIARCITKFKPTPATVYYDDQKLTYPFFNITIGQCKHNGGGTNLVPHADPTDGLFALGLYKNVKPWEVILRAPQFYSGSIAKHKEAVTAQVKHLLIEAPTDTPAYVEVDGEWLGQSPIEFIMLPAAIKVIVP